MRFPSIRAIKIRDNDKRVDLRKIAKHIPVFAELRNKSCLSGTTKFAFFQTKILAMRTKILAIVRSH